MRHGFTLVELPVMSKRGFTLVELLVVVTIIVVLLALLAPALDKAIYQTELAVCAAQQKAVAAGVTTYAVANQRRYADRALATGGNLTVHIARSGVDDRQILRSFMPLKALVDPLVSGVDLETQSTDYVESAFYSLWFDMRYPGHRGMQKLGDRLAWIDGDREILLDLLVSDSDYIIDGNVYFASHPDKGGLMHERRSQDEVGGGIAGAEAITYSYWYLPGDSVRGSLDLNFAKDDGAVLRLNGVTADDRDERVASVPMYNNATNWRVRRQQVPIQ